MTFRVLQWSTGNVGRASLRAVLAHPDLELGGGSQTSQGSVDVDQLSLVRASHALASELRLGPLVRRVIELGIQAAGATRGFLLTERDG